MKSVSAKGWKVLSCETGVQYETIDRGIYNRGIRRSSVPAASLVPGAQLLEKESWDAQVVSFDGERLTFLFRGSEISIGPEDIWASSMYGVPAEYISRSEGIMIWLRVEPVIDPQKAVDRVIELLAEMRENAAEGEQWKNIPVAREFLGLLKNEASFDRGALDRKDIMFACDTIFNEDLLLEHDVPRLCRSFLMLHTLAFHATPSPNPPDYEPESIMSIMDVEKIRNRLDFYVDPHTKMEWYVEYTGASLKFDPVEMTPEWEDNIYEVEAECHRKLKDEPRGMGFCFGYWSTKRAVLAERGIEWHSPSAMNPRVMFD